jgi:hypothetical protein
MAGVIRNYFELEAGKDKIQIIAVKTKAIPGSLVVKAEGRGFEIR